jgi:hypothetical protein
MMVTWSRTVEKQLEEATDRLGDQALLDRCHHHGPRHPPVE